MNYVPSELCKKFDSPDWEANIDYTKFKIYLKLFLFKYRAVEYLHCVYHHVYKLSLEKNEIINAY